MQEAIRNYIMEKIMDHRNKLRDLFIFNNKLAK